MFVSLDPISEADFATIKGLGETIWRTHYSTMISLEQIECMLADRYTPEKLRRYLNSATCWMDILRIDDVPAGYCSCAHTAKPGEMKLEQLYLLQEHRRKGLGGFMLRHMENRARSQGLQSIYLQVNKGNRDSIAVYRKFGFTVREEACFDIGGGFVMDDYVMEKRLG
jgi:ribosomal protein S18 acetylase RimI-like enzyme